MNRGNKRPIKTGGGDNVADILEKVINGRFDVMHSEDDDDDDDDDSDWSD